MKLFHKILSGLALASLLMAGSCDVQSTQSNKQSEAQKAEVAANSINFAGGNAEIDNIKRRLELTSDPALMGYITLFNDMGQPILYATVKGKVTSGSKRLTPPIQQWNVDKGEWGGTEMADAPSDEGTWGSSNPYIFFWTTDGQYIQWSGNYLYSDKPMRLADTPMVVLTAK